MAYLLREYANEPVDIGRVMLMCLIHDIVEINAGDTYAYDSDSQVTQKEREDRAKERIFALLPEDQKRELISLFDEFEANETPEAKYAHSLDNMQHLMLNNSNGGADWRETACQQSRSTVDIQKPVPARRSFTRYRTLSCKQTLKREILKYKNTTYI